MRILVLLTGILEFVLASLLVKLVILQIQYGQVTAWTGFLIIVFTMWLSMKIKNFLKD